MARPRGERIKVVCPTCGIEFEMLPCEVKRGRKWCSVECSLDKEKGRPNRGRAQWTEHVKKICLNCGKEFEVYPSQTDQQFCQRGCVTAYRNKQGFFRDGQWHAVLACPVSVERLRELYWKEQLSVREITEKLIELEAKTTEDMVYRWMIAAGISRRSYRACAKIVFQRYRKSYWHKITAKSLESRRRNGWGFKNRHKLNGHQRAKGRRAWAAIRRAMYETRECAWCGREVTRPPSHFTHPTLAYCCQAHKNKDMPRLKLEKVATQQIDFSPPKKEAPQKRAWLDTLPIVT